MNNNFIEENLNTIILGDCLVVMKNIPDKSIDVIIADPPYEILNTTAGGNSGLSKSMQNMNDELLENKLNIDIGMGWCKEVPRIQEKINCFIWCNKAQVIGYLDYFVKELKCSWQDFHWRKTNAMPTFNNKPLTDREYCLHFRKGGYFNPQNYEDAKTVWDEPININDKKIFNHPTIKPEKIIRTIIRNSTKNENSIILDPFIGSGTTGICAYKENRAFIGIEINPKWHNVGVERLENAKNQQKLF